MRDFVRTMLISALAISGLAVASDVRAGAAGAARSATDRLADVRQRASDARDAHDCGRYRAAVADLRALVHDSPRSLVEAARAELCDGHAAASLQALASYADAGEDDALLRTVAELQPLSTLPGYGEVTAQLRRNARPVRGSVAVTSLGADGLLPEDVDYDARTDRYYVSTVLGRRVLVVGPGRAGATLHPAPDGWPLLALRLDAVRDRLWTTEVALEGFDGVPAADAGRSRLLMYALSGSGAPRTFELPRPSSVGDLVVLHDGRVVASDGAHGGLYLVDAATGAVDRVDQGEFISPQTPVELPDGRVAVPDYVRGLAIVDLAQRSVRWVTAPHKAALVGIDGLYRFRTSLVAVQNGTSPVRIVRIDFDSAWQHVTATRVLERGSPGLGEPTHGVVRGDAFYFIADAGWDRIDEHGRATSGTPAHPTLRRVDLRGSGSPESTR